MKLQFLEMNEIIFLDKPAGFATHTEDLDREGLAEIYSRALGRKLWVVHRLDKTTTGALAFATSERKAAELTEAFRRGLVKRKYRFVTDQNSETDSEQLEITHSSWIEKQGSRFVSLKQTEKNCETQFRRIKRSPFFELWEAETTTDRPHQIRLHAEDLGLAILGDTEHGGNAFPHLCLHAEQIQIPGEQAWLCPSPLFFDRLGVLPDVDFVESLVGFDRRQRNYAFLTHRELCLRLSHLENVNLRWDVLGEVLWGQWYGAEDPSSEDLVRAEVLAHRTKRSFVLQRMQNRGQDPLQKNHWLSLNEPPNRWIAVENNMKINFARDRGLSSGLFLDQRHNRLWLRENAKGLRVLNLFAYTCGFSLAAALGQAQEVTSVDVSPEFLNWGKENFLVNNLDPAQFEFFVQDSIFFLERSLKKNRVFDLIICDPPTFGRHKEGIFRLEKDWKKLLSLCHQSLALQGRLLFSTNFEKWDAETWENKINETKSWKRLKDPSPDFDYEGPNEERLLKSFLLQKKS